MRHSYKPSSNVVQLFLKITKEELQDFILKEAKNNRQLAKKLEYFALDKVSKKNIDINPIMNTIETNLKRAYNEYAGGETAHLLKTLLEAKYYKEVLSFGNKLVLWCSDAYQSTTDDFIFEIDDILTILAEALSADDRSMQEKKLFLKDLQKDDEVGFLVDTITDKLPKRVQ